jgi:hypothetical protein
MAHPVVGPSHAKIAEQVAEILKRAAYRKKTLTNQPICSSDHFQICR